MRVFLHNLYAIYLPPIDVLVRVGGRKKRFTRHDTSTRKAGDPPQDLCSEGPNLYPLCQLLQHCLSLSISPTIIPSVCFCPQSHKVFFLLLLFLLELF